VLDHGLLQERAVKSGGPLPKARPPRVVDVEGRHADDAGTVADHRLVRVGRLASHIVRRHLMRALAIACLVAAVLGASAAAVALAGPDVTASQRRALCGVERWTVKTLQDRPRLLPVKRVTLAYLVSRRAPAALPTTRLPFERHVFRVTAAVTIVRSEDDGDLHLVLSDGRRTMIAEAPLALLHGEGDSDSPETDETGEGDCPHLLKGDRHRSRLLRLQARSDGGRAERN
jgi:hypothetical protein